MNKYLTLLKPTTANYRNIKFNFTHMNCGNGYKEGTQHKFESKDPEDIKLLIDIIRRFRFGTKITEITKESFVFESQYMKTQVFLFRICRYTRFKNLRKILEDTIKINKAGVRIQNAFLLAHYYNYKNDAMYLNIDYYNTSMDGFHDPSSNNNDIYLNKPFKTLKEFKLLFENNKGGITYNNVFYYYKSHSKFIEKKTLFGLLKNDDFKAAEKYLLYVFKL